MPARTAAPRTPSHRSHSIAGRGGGGFVGAPEREPAGGGGTGSCGAGAGRSTERAAGRAAGGAGVGGAAAGWAPVRPAAALRPGRARRAERQERRPAPARCASRGAPGRARSRPGGHRSAGLAAAARPRPPRDPGRGRGIRGSGRRRSTPSRARPRGQAPAAFHRMVEDDVSSPGGAKPDTAIARPSRSTRFARSGRRTELGPGAGMRLGPSSPSVCRSVHARGFARPRQSSAASSGIAFAGLFGRLKRPSSASAVSRSPTPEGRGCHRSNSPRRGVRPRRAGGPDRRRHGPRAR